MNPGKRVCLVKQVVSVSLGSSKRDHAVETEWLGQPLRISRRGTDGDVDRAIALLRELDGQVDAIGLGGIDIYLFVADKRYVIGEGLKLAQVPQRTPVVDGSGVKHTVERDAIYHLHRHTSLLPAGTPVLVVSAMDRFGMAEALLEIGCDCTFGDLIFSLGIDHPIKTTTELAAFAEKFKSRLEKLPIRMLYTVGEAQDAESRGGAFDKYYDAAQVLAGDTHFIKRHLPLDISGKTIITQTTTSADVELFRARGARYLITTTPVMEGRSFATNVIEAVLVALLERPLSDITTDDYRRLMAQLDLRPVIREL